MDSNKVRIALIFAVKAANAALNTDITLPSGLVAGVILQVELNFPVYKSAALSGINKIANSFAKNPAGEESSGGEESGDNQNLEQDESNQPKQDQKSELSPIGQMNQRPERRHYPQTEKLGKSDNPKQDGDHQRLGTMGQMNQRRDQKPEKERSSFKNKVIDGLTEWAGKKGDKYLPKSRIPERGEAKPKDRSDVIDSDYEPGATKKNNLLSNWNKLRGSIRNKKDKDNINESRSATGEIVNRGSRLLSFEFYRLCWLNLIDSFGLTYFGLLFLFIAKYVAHSPKIIKFVSMKDVSVRLEIIENREKTDTLSIVTFIALTTAIVAVFSLAILLIFFYLKAMSLTFWGLITDSEQFFEDWKIIWEFIRAAKG